MKMFSFVVPALLCLATTARGYREVASEAQIRFALENKYDDSLATAERPQFAYNTYHSLDDALIAYLDDPDTKLPEHERNRAVQHLVQKNYGQYEHPVQRYYPKTVEEYTGYNKPKPSLVLTKLNAPKKYAAPVFGFSGPLLKEKQEGAEPYKVARVKPVRGKPVSVAHYSREPELQDARDQYILHPKYTFSNGLHAGSQGGGAEGGARGEYYGFLGEGGRTTLYSDGQLGYQPGYRTQPY